MVKKTVLFVVLFVAGFVFLFATPVFALTAEEISVSGDPSNRVDVVVLCDGYTSSQQDKCRSDVNWFVSGMLSQEPFATYATHYNFWVVPIVSSQSGADHPSRNVYVDTALDATYDCHNIERLICVDSNKAYNAAADAFPEYDYITVLVNDTQYGGSGGSISVISINQYSPLIATHEFGHTHGDLADEYTNPYPGFPPGCPEPNVTCETERDQIPWNVWIENSTPIPTPESSIYSNVVGLFEGARYQEHGVYRPQMSCIMRELDSPYCKICSEALALADYDYINIIESTTPEKNSTINLNGSNSVLVQAYLVYPSVNNSLSISWTLGDGTTIASGTDSVVLYASTFPSDGNYTLYLTVEDATGKIRNDPMGKSINFASWSVVVLGGFADGDADDDIDIDDEQPEIAEETDLPVDADVDADPEMDEMDEVADFADGDYELLDAVDEVPQEDDLTDFQDAADFIDNMDVVDDAVVDGVVDIPNDSDSANITLTGASSSDSGCVSSSLALPWLFLLFGLYFLRRGKRRGFEK